MRKIFTFLCGVLFAAQFTTVSAQTTKMKVYKTDGSVVEYSTSEVDSVTFSQEVLPSYKIINGHKFINLGLPSGLYWAETNIGAESETDYGTFFAWAETDMTTKEYYSWNNYKYGTSDNLSKYNATDGKTALDQEDDAAYINWGDSCRMPTREEIMELSNTEYCTWSWTSQTNSSGADVYGYKVTSTTNGNSIFIPASGRYDGRDCDYQGVMGYLWTSSLDLSSTDRAYYITFLDYDIANNTSGERYLGKPVRPGAK